jgi:hypothetical protein
MVGGTDGEFHREVIQRDVPRAFGPSTSLAHITVLTHRKGEVCLDNAFAVIEGHPARLQVGDLRLSGFRNRSSVAARLRTHRKTR